VGVLPLHDEDEYEHSGDRHDSEEDDGLVERTQNGIMLAGTKKKHKATTQ
jgi:hypothetical protein